MTTQSPINSETSAPTIFQYQVGSIGSEVTVTQSVSTEIQYEILEYHDWLIIYIVLSSNQCDNVLLNVPVGVGLTSEQFLPIKPSSHSQNGSSGSSW